MFNNELKKHNGVKMKSKGRNERYGRIEKE